MTTQLSPRLEELKRWYVASAVMLLNCVLVGVVLGGAFLLARGAVRALAARSRVSSVEKKYGDRIFGAYPDMSKEQVRTLLWETWTRPCVYEPFTQFSERPCSGRFVNVSAQGFRDSLNQAAWPPDTNAFNVFVFGGSTTFGYGLPDSQTVPSFLQSWLRTNVSPRVCVYNFGRAYYYSSQELVLFLRLLAAGQVPRLAVFLDGLNDSMYWDDRPMFSNRLRALMESGRGGRVSFPADREENSPAQGAAESGDTKVAARVAQRYLANMQLAKALAGAYGVQVAFVWQPIPTYKYDLQHHHFRDSGFRRHKHAPAVFEQMNQKRAALAGDRSFIWCADMQEGIAESLYLDEVHYNAALARRLAAKIGQELVARGLVTVP